MRLRRSRRRTTSSKRMSLGRHSTLAISTRRRTGCPGWLQCPRMKVRTQPLSEISPIRTSLRDLSEIRSCSLEISSDDAYCSWRVLGICSSLACSLQPDLRGAQHNVEPCAVHRLVRHDLRRAGHQRRLHCTPRGRRSLCQATALKRIGSALPPQPVILTKLCPPLYLFSFPKLACFQSWQPKGCRTQRPTPLLRCGCRSSSSPMR